VRYPLSVTGCDPLSWRIELLLAVSIVVLVGFFAWAMLTHKE
jgi:hypothetical protein